MDWPDELDDADFAETFFHRLSDDHFQLLAEHMKKWADSDDFGSEEWESFDYPASGQGYAFRFFNQQNYDFCKTLGVEVIEGDRPGSNYYAAELRIPVDEANKVAADNGIPVRFQKETGK